jgi:hypothetical protein
MGPGGIKTKKNNPRPQAEAKDNDHYLVSKRDVGYEEDTCRVKSCADVEEGTIDPYETSPRASIRDNHEVGGGN